MTLLILTVHSWNTSGLLIFLILKVLFLIFSILLLVYLLFFEIPLSPQFKKTKDRTVVNHGSYGIVRHPAFYPFLLVTIALSLIVWDWSFVFIACYLNLLNFMLIAMEDLFLFPKMFTNYSEYKKQVPFLFPNLKFRFKKI
jgi:protein-S-isoprenylcysteine O-methyltransferase Ste14